MPDQPAPSLPDVIGHNCREIRLRGGWTQGEVSAACLRAGLGWGYRRVAQLEAGEVAASLPTLLRLTAALDSLGGSRVTVTDLLQWEGPIRLSEHGGDEIPGPLLLAALTGAAPGREIAELLAPFTSGEDDAVGRPQRAAADYGRADSRAAADLGLKRAAMVDLTRRLWGHSLEAERNRRAEESGIGQNRAARAWVTAELRRQLREELDRERCESQQS